MANPNPNPGKGFFRELFEKLGKGDEPLPEKVKRSAAAAGHVFVDQLMQAFPKSSIAKVAEAAMGQAIGKEAFQKLGAKLQNVSLEEVEDFFEQIKGNLTDEQQSQQVAMQLKMMAGMQSAEQFRDALDEAVSQLPEALQARLAPTLASFAPQIDSAFEAIKQLPPDQLAERIRQYADTIPTHVVSANVQSVLMNITPERLNAVANVLTRRLPSPESVADKVHGLGEAAIRQLSRAANPEGADKPASMKEFIEEAQKILKGGKDADAGGGNAPAPRKPQGQGPKAS